MRMADGGMQCHSRIVTVVLVGKWVMWETLLVVVGQLYRVDNNVVSIGVTLLDP